MQHLSLAALLLAFALTGCNADATAPVSSTAPSSPITSYDAGSASSAMPLPNAPEVSPGDGKAAPGNNASVGGGTETGLPPEMQQKVFQ